MNNRVLILGVAPVQMDAILELNSMGYETFACAMAKDGPGADIAHNFEKINILDIDSLIDFIYKKNISVVYSVGSDLAMPVVSKVSEKLKLPHFVSEKSARICNNKNLMRETLGNDFIGNVKFQVIKNINESIELTYPFIMKPADSQGQRGVILVHNDEEFMRNFNIVKNFSRSGIVILENYISGPEISVNGYVIDGKIKYLIPSDRVTWPQYTGLIRKHVLPAKNFTDESQKMLYCIIQSACNKIGIDNGPVYAQVKIEDNKPYIIEITPRLDGCHMWKLLSYYTGVNLLKLTFEHLLRNDTSELDKFKMEVDSGYVLEFICQQPNTKANYTSYYKNLHKSIESFLYYEEDEFIRPVNGKFEKIGYFINKIKVN